MRNFLRKDRKNMENNIKRTQNKKICKEHQQQSLLSQFSGNDIAECTILIIIPYFSHSYLRKQRIV